MASAYGIISQLIKLKPNVVEISNRTEKTAIKLKNHFSDHDKTIIKVRPWGFQPNSVPIFLINTSTHGMNHSDKLSFNLDLLSKKLLFMTSFIVLERQNYSRKQTHWDLKIQMAYIC